MMHAHACIHTHTHTHTHTLHAPTHNYNTDTNSTMMHAHACIHTHTHTHTHTACTRSLTQHRHNTHTQHTNKHTCTHPPTHNTDANSTVTHVNTHTHYMFSLSLVYTCTYKGWCAQLVGSLLLVRVIFLLLGSHENVIFLVLPYRVVQHNLRVVSFF